MKRVIAVFLFIAILMSAQTGVAFAMTEEEVLKAVEASEGKYVVGGPLTRDDFIAYESGSYSGENHDVFTDDSKMEKYEYDELLYLFVNDFTWHIHGPATRKDDFSYDSYCATYTYRGINVDFDTKENVRIKYGIGIEGIFDPSTDVIYKYQRTHGADRKEDAAEMHEKCKTHLTYNYKDFAQIRFYFNDDDKVIYIAYYPGIQEYVDKDTTLKIQEYLNENGYDCGRPDGVAGKKTKDALKQFQEEHNLYPSGYIDDCLMKYLDEQNVNI